MPDPRTRTIRNFLIARFPGTVTVAPFAVVAPPMVFRVTFKLRGLTTDRDVDLYLTPGLFGVLRDADGAEVLSEDGERELREMAIWAAGLLERAARG